MANACLWNCATECFFASKRRLIRVPAFSRNVNRLALVIAKNALFERSNLQFVVSSLKVRWGRKREIRRDWEGTNPLKFESNFDDNVNFMANLFPACDNFVKFWHGVLLLGYLTTLTAHHECLMQKKVKPYLVPITGCVWAKLIYEMWNVLTPFW